MRRKQDIFALLESAGVPRADLQLAWDFTTASLASTTGWMVAIRDDATARIPESGPAYTVVSVTDEVNDRIYRTIEAEMTVPHYMTNGAQPGSTLVIGPDGLPAYQGTVTVPFTVHIPRACVQQRCPIVDYGHGLFINRAEAANEVPTGVAAAYGYVLVAVDMWGMCDADLLSVWQALRGDLSTLVQVSDRLHQGVLNHLLVMKAMRGAFAADPVSLDAIDPARPLYWGISLGGIMVGWEQGGRGAGSKAGGWVGSAWGRVVGAQAWDRREGKPASGTQLERHRDRLTAQGSGKEVDKWTDDSGVAHCAGRW